MPPVVVLRGAEYVTFGALELLLGRETGIIGGLLLLLDPPVFVIVSVEVDGADGREAGIIGGAVLVEDNTDGVEVPVLNDDGIPVETVGL